MRNSEIAMTLSGKYLIMRALVESKPIVFTEARVGTGTVGDDVELKTMTALIAPVLRGATIQSRRIDSAGNVIVIVEVSNASYLERTPIDEIGLYAKLDGDSESVLFSYMTLGDYPDIVPPSSVASVKRMYHQIFSLGDGTEVEVNYMSEDLPGTLYYMDDNDKGIIEVDEQ